MGFSPILSINHFSPQGLPNTKYKKLGSYACLLARDKLFCGKDKKNVTNINDHARLNFSLS